MSTDLRSKMSLRTFHLFFVLCVMVVMDLIGGWGLWHYERTGEGSMLMLSIVGLVTSLAIAGYGLFVLFKFDHESIA